jgi:hypothetical protein
MNEQCNRIFGSADVSSAEFDMLCRRDVGAPSWHCFDVLSFHLNMCAIGVQKGYLS